MEEFRDYAHFLSQQMKHRDAAQPMQKKSSSADKIARQKIQASGRYVRRDSAQSFQDSKSRSQTPDQRPTKSQLAAAPQFVSFQCTTDLLIHLSRRVIEILDARDYKSPFLGCLSQDLQSISGDCIHAGRDKVLEEHRQSTEAFPEYRTEIQNATATIDDEVGRACVILTTRISGYVYETMRQSACLLTWTRTNDKWTCAQLITHLGLEEYD